MSKRVLTSAIVLLTCCSLAAWSQEASKSTQSASKATASAEKKPTNRLPSNYGKLGLTDAQKDKVYAIQEKYGKQLDDLETQIQALKTKRDGEIEAVLSVEQKKILKDITDEAKETKAKSKKSDDKDKK